VSTILIIRPGAIGDSLLAFPILCALRRQYPNAHILFAGNAAVLPLALASGLADEVSDFNDPQWSALFSASGISHLNERYDLHTADLAICWLRDSDGIVEHNLLAVAIKRVIVAPGRPPEGQRMHIVDYLAGTIGLNSIEKDIFLSNSIHAVAQENVLLNTVAIHPGSGGARKCWPIDRFAEVIKHLWQHDHPVLLLIGPADVERLNALRNLLPSPPTPNLLSILENTPLLEVARQLGNCACYLGNDSGITHLAAMLGLPTIALFGPSDPAIWRPPGSHVEVIWEPELEQLPVEMVMEHLPDTQA
jgi:heptosyltransferase-3